MDLGASTVAQAGRPGFDPAHDRRGAARRRAGVHPRALGDGQADGRRGNGAAVGPGRAPRARVRLRARPARPRVPLVVPQVGSRRRRRWRVPAPPARRAAAGQGDDHARRGLHGRRGRGPRARVPLRRGHARAARRRRPRRSPRGSPRARPARSGCRSACSTRASRPTSRSLLELEGAYQSLATASPTSSRAWPRSARSVRPGSKDADPVRSRRAVPALIAVVLATVGFAGLGARDRRPRRPPPRPSSPTSTSPDPASSPRATTPSALQARLGATRTALIFRQLHARAHQADGVPLDDHTIDSERTKAKATKDLAFEYAIDRTVAAGGTIVPFGDAGRPHRGRRPRTRPSARHVHAQPPRGAGAARRHRPRHQHLRGAAPVRDRLRHPPRCRLCLRRRRAPDPHQPHRPRVRALP